MITLLILIIKLCMFPIYLFIGLIKAMFWLRLVILGVALE